MKNPKFPHHRIVQLYWLDITGHEDTWTEQKDIKPDPTHVLSVGYLVHEDDHYVVLAEGVSADKGYNQLSTFPKGCIVNMKELT